MSMLKGNAIVGQSGGPTAAINATLAGVIRGFFEYGKGNTIYGMRNGMEGFLEERLVNLNERFAKESDIELLEHTPAAALGSCRKKLPAVEGNEDYYEKIFTLFTAGILVPLNALMVPYFVIINKIGLYNTYGGMILLYCAIGIPMSHIPRKR